MSDWKLTCQKYKTNNPDAECNCSVCCSERLATVEAFSEKLKKTITPDNEKFMEQYEQGLTSYTKFENLRKVFSGLIDQLVEEERKG